MAYSLRLPDSLDAQARQRAGVMGISLNSLICVALDAYLKPVELVASVKPELQSTVAPGASSPVAPVPMPSAPGRVIRKQKRKGRR